MNRKLIDPLIIAMILILLDLGLSMMLQNTHTIPLTNQAWLTEAYQHPNVLLYHLDALNLIIAWVFAVFFYALKQTNVRFKGLFIIYAIGLGLMTLMNRAFLIWLLMRFTQLSDTMLISLIHQGRHDAIWTLPGFLIQNLSVLLFAFTFLQKKTTRMLGILGCLGFGVLSVYLILIRFIAINPMMMGLAAIGGLVSLAFYGLLIKQLYHHSV